MTCPPGHPHVRGDYSCPFHGVREEVGPSPRAWGLLEVNGLVDLVGRAIPTCVGTTGSSMTPRPRFTGHPHVRGDYIYAHLGADGTSGPSPRAWGLRGPPRRGGCPERSIPTCVGTTPSPPGPRRPPPVHPHVRGDYAPDSRRAVFAAGPSPRAWGLRRGTLPSRGSSPVHPHVRGDYARRSPLETTQGTVHPHVRGDYEGAEGQ